MKKDRHDGRPILYDNVEKQRAGSRLPRMSAMAPAHFYVVLSLLTPQSHQVCEKIINFAAVIIKTKRYVYNNIRV